MLAYIPSSSPNYNYLPTIPSPLSPRSANIHGRHSASMSSKPQPSLLRITPVDENAPNPALSTTSKHFTSTTSNASSKPAFSQRAPRSAPLPKPTELKDRRRNAFFRKVSNQREERRYGARGEDMMRLDFMQRQRAWEADRAREAEFVPSQELIEEEEEEHQGEYELPGMQVKGTKGEIGGEDEVEEFLRDEEGEIEALLEFMPPQGEGLDEEMEDETSLWSDDADYDALFEQVLSQQEQQQQPMCQGMDMQIHNEPQQGEEMDMS